MEDKLAINGGKPIRESYLNYGRQDIDEADIHAVIEVLKGDYITTGPNISNFEKIIADYVGAKYAVAIANGTAALHAAAFVAGISEGDEVIVPAMTFAATANCVKYCGGIPVFVDIDPLTYNIDITKIEAAITERTKAIIPVDFSGQSVDMDKIMEIAEKHNLIVIEDGAHALGSEYKGKKVGAQAHMTEFSFHPVKPITTGEGGVVTTNSKELYHKLIMFRSHGITREPDFMFENHGSWYYEQHFLGFNYRLTDIQGALGISQMRRLDEFIHRRREIVKIYNEAFKDIEEVITPYEAEFSNSGCHIYIIRLDLAKLNGTRREVFEALKAENIGVNIHYLPVYLHPYYQKLGYKRGLCIEAEKLYDSMFTLPLYPRMTEKDINDVIDGLNKVVKFYSKVR